MLIVMMIDSTQMDSQLEQHNYYFIHNHQLPVAIYRLVCMQLYSPPCIAMRVIIVLQLCYGTDYTILLFS